MDPEDWRNVVAAYQAAAAAIIERYEGHVAQFLGDGILAYFGYPMAHEDDAGRALRAALAIVESMAGVNEQVGLAAERRLRVRVGIHTGEVVIGESGGAGRQETQAFGSATNIAARLQGVAEPDCVVISETTRRLVAGQFVTRGIGTPELKGVDEPIAAHIVVQPSGVKSRLDVAQTITPLVGRTLELGLLEDRWERVHEGRGQVILLSGEAGIGKSRLVLALRERLSAESHTWLECRCSHYTAGSPFAPVIDVVQQGLGISDTDDDVEKLRKLTRRMTPDGLPADVTVPVLARFLGIDPNVAPDPGLSPEALRERAIDALVQWGLAMSAHQPVLMLVEDLHWCDPSSLEFLDRLIEQAPTARMCVLMTARPEFQSRWQASSHFSPLALGTLTERQVRQMLLHLRAEGKLPVSSLEEVVERADGVPLHVEELTTMLIDRTDATSKQPVEQTAVPLTLEGSLLARLDRLKSGKEIAQLASVLGREFSHRLLASVYEGDSSALDAGLRELVRAGVLFVRGRGVDAEYVFKHGLIQEAAYRSLLKSVRRRWHHRAASALRSEFPRLAERRPELVARHHTEANDWSDAADCWLRAGKRAVETSANIEAVTYLEQALECLGRTDDAPERLQNELAIHLALGPPRMATRGYADERVEHGYSRALAICSALGEPAELLPVKFGLWTYHCLRAKHVVGRDLAEKMTERADQADDDGLRVEAALALGANLFYLGELEASASTLRKALALYDAEAHATHRFVYGQDPGVAAHGYEAFDLWLLGDLDAALRSSARGLELARSLDHPFTLTYALTFAAWFHRIRGDAATCLAIAEELHHLASERQVVLYRAVGAILIGSSTAELRSPAEGLDRLERGLDEYQRTGSSVIEPYWQALLADAYRRVGRFREGMAAVDRGLAAVAATAERWCEAELHRVRAVLLEEDGASAADVLAAYDAAIGHATLQGAKGWALRAALGACQYSSARGDREAARDRLASVRSSFADSAVSEEIRRADTLLVSTI